jgi:hypothetical protein
LLEVSDIKLTGIMGCTNNPKMLKIYHPGDELILSGTIKNNTSILSNRFKILP